jgi:signal transduction histidine kinase/anti-sigma regulatory factor (Ser/Thr protein kinase)
MHSCLPLLTVAIAREQDVLLARQRARQISHFLGFSSGDTTRITTALSEVARNAFENGGGAVAFALETRALEPRELVIHVTAAAKAKSAAGPPLNSDTGGIGLKGSRALMDRFETTSSNGSGTTVMMTKVLPRSSMGFRAADVARLTAELAKTNEATPLGELQVQNQALLTAFQELTRRQAEIERLGGIADDARDHAEAAQRVAERSLVVRDRFMALTTHELRTPLNAIMGYLDLLDLEIAASLTDRQKDYFARAQRACKHLLGLTNDFLDMAQDDAGRLKVARHEGAARHVMSEASSLVAPQAAARNVMVHLAETTDRITYFGDVDRVRQVLVNVLGNAVSFSRPGGRVDVIATRETVAPQGSELTGGPWCTIRVEDSGPGIPSDKLGHVFEPFVQLSSDGQATRKGSGLGLTVSRQLAVLMGGDLTVASSGEGAVFTLWLAEGSAHVGPRLKAPREHVDVSS